MNRENKIVGRENLFVQFQVFWCCMVFTCRLKQCPILSKKTCLYFMYLLSWWKKLKAYFSSVSKLIVPCPYFTSLGIYESLCVLDLATGRCISRDDAENTMSERKLWTFGPARGKGWNDIVRKKDYVG